MSKELGGYGPTAGESMGGTGANMNEQGGNNSGVNWLPRSWPLNRHASSRNGGQRKSGCFPCSRSGL